MMRLAGIAVVALAACSGLAGCRASKPGRFETTMIQWAKQHVTIGGGNAKNPLPDSQDTLKQGKAAFGSYCMVCHGLDAQNTGVPFADRVDPPIPSLASKDVQRYKDGQLKWIIENGIAPSGMPASKGILSDEDMWAIVVYLRHLPPAGSLGEPRVYSGEETDDEQK